MDRGKAGGTPKACHALLWDIFMSHQCFFTSCWKVSFLTQWQLCPVLCHSAAAPAAMAGVGGWKSAASGWSWSITRSHRIMKYPALEGTHKDHRDQCLTLHRLLNNPTLCIPGSKLCWSSGSLGTVIIPWRAWAVPSTLQPCIIQLPQCQLTNL